MSFVGVGQSVCMLHSFPFGIEGGMWDVIVLIPNHCPSIYLDMYNPCFHSLYTFSPELNDMLYLPVGRHDLL